MGGRWLYSCCFVGCCLQDLFNIAHSTLVQLLSSYCSIHLVSIHVVHPYSSINATVAGKKLRFILLVKSDFYITNSLLIAVHAFVKLHIDVTLLPRYVNLSTSFKELLFSVEMSPLWLMHMYFIQSALTWRPRLAAACSRLCSRVSAWAGVFARSAMSSA